MCALIQHGIIPIRQYSVESIYYHPLVIHSVLKRVAPIHGIDIDETITQMNNSIIEAFKPHVDRMAARMIEREIRDKLLRKIPSWKSILGGDCHINFSTQESFDKKKESLISLIVNQDIVGLISRYQVRETPVLECVSKALGFQSQDKYEQAVRKMLFDEDDVRIKVLNILKPVTDYINSL